jgi:hypothetical protein
MKHNYRKDWLDSSGRFVFGKYAGELAYSIARRDPSYLRWIVDEVEDL